MLIGEAAASTGLTKKAIRYYIEQGLLNPETQSAGSWLNFTDGDVETLAMIRELRGLNLNVSEIRGLLDCPPSQLLLLLRQHLQRISAEQDHLSELQRRLGQLLECCETAGGGDIRNAILALGARSKEGLPRFRDRLSSLFPGPFGTMLACHFEAFLPEEPLSEEQEAAWEELIRRLDELEPASYPEELERLYGMFSPEAVREMIEQNRKSALHLAHSGPEALIPIAERLRAAIQASPSSSPLHGMIPWMNASKQALARSGYYDIIPPLMRRISPLYDQYMNRLEELQRLVPVRADHTGYHLP
ncbi:MerR family transcriptional regulator [Gorillibacterium sp. sgz5001074]|uniref:MerR family transcriptional regulator n=1 Tax=Gorillibacterium sp. sgz5001074 TaxID=3446695 RepID=UPI003F675FF9